MKPVKLEVLIENNTKRGASDVIEDVEKMAGTSEEAWKKTNEALQSQRDVVARLKKELPALENAWNKINTGSQNPEVVTEREKLSEAIRNLRTELEGEEEALRELEKAQTGVANGQQTLIRKIRAVKDAMFQLKVAGKQESQMYREKEAELRTLATAFRELKKEQELLSTGGSNLAGFMSGMSAVTGTLSAGAGAMGLLNIKNEDYARLQTRIQSLMAITIGLQQVQNTLHQTSAFRLHTVARGKQAWTSAVTFLNTKLKLSIGLSKALVALGIGAILAAIGILIVKMKRWAERQREINELQRQYREISKGVAREVAAQQSNIKRLMRIAEDYTRDINLRRKAVAELNRLMPEYNGFIDASGRLTANAADALRIYLQNLVKMERAKRLISQQADLRDSISDRENTDVELSRGDRLLIWTEEGRESRRRQLRIEKERELREDRRIYAEHQKKIDALIDEMSPEAAADLLGLRTETATTTVDNTARDLERAYERLRRLGVDAQRGTDAAIIAVMQEGRGKRLAELKHEHNQRLARIAEQQKEIAELEYTTGIDGSRQREQLNDLATAEIAKYEARVKAVIDGAANAIASIMDDIDSRFQTSNERRIADVERFFDRKIEIAKENAATQAQLDEIELQRARDLAIEKQHIALETLDFENQIAIRRAQIEDRRIMLAIDREEKLLRIQIAAAEKRLRKLQEIEAAGGDVGRDIELITVEIEAMNTELNRIPLQRMQELAGYFTQVLSGIGGFVANFDADLGAFLDKASDAIGGIVSIGTGIATGNPKEIIDGAMQLLNVAGRVIRAGREANEEIRRFNVALAQQAIEYSLAVIRSIREARSETDNIFTTNHTNTLTQGMASHNAAIEKQTKLMRELGNQTIQTGVRRRRFLGITIGTRDVFDNLLRQYPQLIQQDGTLNRQLAETLMTSGRLNDETSALIGNILKAGDAADEAMRAVQSELQNLVGSLGTELKRALHDAFASGTDAAQDMTNNVARLLKDLSTQKLFNAVFGGLFSQLEERMKNSFGIGGSGDLTNDINWFMSQWERYMDDYNRGLAKIRDAIMAQHGVNPFEMDGRSAVQRGIAQASQDSIDELNGRMTFMGIVLTEIREGQGGIAQFVFKIFGVLSRIADNTDRLEQIEEDMAAVKNNTDRIIRDGLKIQR